MISFAFFGFHFIAMFISFQLAASQSCDYAKKFIDIEDCHPTCTCPGSRCGFTKLSNGVKAFSCQNEADYQKLGGCDIGMYFDYADDCAKFCNCTRGVCTTGTTTHPSGEKVFGRNQLRQLPYHTCSSRCRITNREASDELCYENICKCDAPTFCREGQCRECYRQNVKTYYDKPLCDLNCFGNRTTCGACTEFRKPSPSGFTTTYNCNTPGYPDIQTATG